jgi:hypothetical protein
MAKQKTIKRRIRRARPLHKKIFLHPLAVFLILCAGVVLLGTSLGASATDISVVATVAAPLPSAPARVHIVSPISEPWLQQTVAQGNSPKTAIFTNTKTVTLTGDCPADTHIQFYRNGLFAGVTSCIGDPTFSITIDLVPGLNIIKAKVFNITNDEGPVSDPIYLNYQLPPSQAPVINTPFLNLSSDFSYLGFLVGRQASWNVIVNGGTPPFHVSVDWGDGNSYSYAEPNNGTVDIRHTYKKASGPDGYEIVVRVTDSKGQKATLNLLTIISNPNTSQAHKIALANAALHPGFFARLKRWLWLAWPAYIIVLLMLISFWLGEREEYYRIVRKFRRRKK